MKTILFIHLASIFWYATCENTEKQTLVTTPLGTIKGTIVTDLKSQAKQFLGIPYALPPVGELRFQKPEPANPWDETFVADNNSYACTQFSEYEFPWYDSDPGKSEDCLYLNIFTPVSANQESYLAVMFFIHGGGFALGSNRQKIYNGTRLAIQGNVIVVTINYRLGLFGFLTSDSEEAPGNAGFYDILMALEWVNDNIEFFGGDKNRITIQGQNAGSLAASLLCVSPLSKGLFSRVILESASATILKDDPKKKNLELSQRLAKTVGCASDELTITNDTKNVVCCLKDKDPEELAHALTSFGPHDFLSFFPQYGDDILPKNAVKEIRKGNFHNVPILIGNSKDEGTFQITTKHPQIFGFYGEKKIKINKTQGRDLIRDFFKDFKDPEKFVKYYLDDVPDHKNDLIRKQVYTASGDFTIICQTVYFAESYAKKGNDVYFYVFEHRPKKSPWASWMGTTDFDEFQFVYGEPLKKGNKYPSNEKKLSIKLMNVWSHFANYGYPSDDFEWPKYSIENHTYMIIDTKFKGNRYGSGPQLDNCNFLRGFYGF